MCQFLTEILVELRHIKAAINKAAWLAGCASGGKQVVSSEIDAARDEVLAHTLDAWDSNMRAIGLAIIGQTDRPDVWSLVYRTFLEQQGLLYQPGAEWAFLEDVD
jgi:hypothetical protein